MTAVIHEGDVCDTSRRKSNRSFVYITCAYEDTTCPTPHIFNNKKIKMSNANPLWASLIWLYPGLELFVVSAAAIWWKGILCYTVVVIYFQHHPSILDQISQVMPPYNWPRTHRTKTVFATADILLALPQPACVSN
ncbi:hypothetical protein NQ317_011899 [Molorchus minor]|uniref:Uncharacterized protein n=1 Tax=Molorchus minor TaxID=1323400 RepID=A0ABQ9IS53_9CUCU|nr:hypothetical protein NQ317_011899 [Molorchus minor]